MDAGKEATILKDKELKLKSIIIRGRENLFAKVLNSYKEEGA